MKRAIAMVLLVVGIGLSAAFGARNGGQHTSYLTAQGAISAATTDAERESATAARDAIGLPPPRQRLADWFAVGGMGWGFGVVLIVIGAGMARRELAAAAASGGGGGGVNFPRTVNAVVAKIIELELRLEGLAFDEDAPDARDQIDDIMASLIEPLVDGRAQLIAKHGLAPFALYFGPFSGGERNLGRCWSALTDGHADEARASAAIARESFKAAAHEYVRIDAAS